MFEYADACPYALLDAFAEGALLDAFGELFEYALPAEGALPDGLVERAAGALFEYADGDALFECADGALFANGVLLCVVL